MSPLNVYTTKVRTPVVVIQAAYKKYCAPTKNPEPTLYVGDWNFAYESVVVEKQAPQYVHDPACEPWLKFQQLVIMWHAQRGIASSIVDSAMCPAYQAIIGMGPE